MSKELDTLYRWLCSTDIGLEQFAKTHHDASVESVLEDMLWEHTASFVRGPLAAMGTVLEPAHELIQYFSYPLYSHYKAGERKEPYWVGKCPIYFGGGNEQAQASAVARYSILYRGFIQKTTGFSFTGFAGNRGWGADSSSPRFVIFNFVEEVHASPMVRVANSGGVLHFEIELNSADKDFSNYISSAINTSTTPPSLPFIANNFFANDKDCFFKWFQDLQASSDCAACEFALLESIKHIPAVLKTTLEPELKKILLSEQSKIDTEGLAHFMALNTVLGFRKLIYIPYRTVEPSTDHSGSDVISWGGIILALKNTLDLGLRNLTFLHDDGAAIPAQSNAIAPLIAAMKLFVDVTTSRASIGDWKHYQKSFQQRSVHRNHANAIRAGFEHEIRHLQEMVNLSAPEFRKDITLATNMEVSIAVSKLVWEAHMAPHETTTLALIIAELKSLFSWPDFQIDILDSLSDEKLPQPMRFVAAELIRSAYAWGGVPSPAAIRTCCVSLSVADKNLLFQVTNFSRKKDDYVFDTNTSREGHGLNLVDRVVSDLIKGSFSFVIKDRIAIARIQIPLPVPKGVI